MDNFNEIVLSSLLDGLNVKEFCVRFPVHLCSTKAFYFSTWHTPKEAKCKVVANIFRFKKGFGIHSPSISISYL